VKEIDKDPFSEFLVKLGRQLIEREWKDMKRIYRIPQGIQIDDAYDFFDWLRQRNIIRPSNLYELMKLLTGIGKENLVNELVIPFELGKLQFFIQD
jgi:hypothetical protein